MKQGVLAGFFLSLCILVFSCTTSSTFSGELDATFGTAGVTLVDFSGLSDTAHAVAVNSSGEVYVVGRAGNATEDFGIAKLTSAGVLDTTFSADGKDTQDIGGSTDDEAYAVTLQTDGKILAVGKGGSDSSAGLALVRWNTDGTLDTSFGTNGIFYNVLVSGYNEFRSIALDTLGRIYVAGNVTSGGKSRFALVRLTALGALDTTFGTNLNGVETTAPYADYDVVTSMVLTTDAVWVAGSAHIPVSVTATTAHSDFLLRKYSRSGPVQGTSHFDFSGIEGTTSSHVYDDRVYSMARDTSGSLILAGSSTMGGLTYFATARFLSSGTLDTTFGTRGAVMTTIKETTGTSTINVDGVASSLLISSTGYYLMAGTSAGTTRNSFAVTRLNSFGQERPFLAENSATLLTLDTTTASANGSALQTDGKWVIVGQAGLGSNSDFALVRFSP
ncbi:hypothetical protein K2X33_08085 [bacterium]|nr:hypothetical protein [bacterium]